MKARMLVVCAVMLSRFVFSGSAFGLGLDNPAIGIKAFVMGAAFSGIADDASAVHHNPSGLAFNDKEVLYCQLYVHYEFVGFTYTGPAGKDESDERYINPGFFISKTYDKWAFGFGYYIPFGGGGFSFDDFQGIPGNNMEILMGLVAIHPAVAYRLGPNLSLGAGIFMYMGNYEEEFPGYENEYDGIAGYGGNIGIMYRPFEKLSVGFNVRGKSSIEMDGDEKLGGIKYDSEVEFDVPYYFDLGFGYKPTQNLTLGLSVVRMTWSDTDEYNFTVLGKRETNFKDSWRLGAGIEYVMSDKFSIWTGLKYYNPSSDKKYLYAGTSEIDQYTVTVGVAYNIRDSIELDVSGLYNYGSEKHDSQKYKTEHFFITLGTRVRY